MMSELSDESSESELLNCSLSMWHGVNPVISREELDVPLDIHTAASIGQYEVVKGCIQRGNLNLNQKNCGGWTPLMYASYIGHDTVVNLLLEAGVGVNISTPEGQTPLMLASSCGNESVAYFLLQQGAELEMKDCHGWTALFHCTSAGHQQMVKFLLENGANANTREPLHGFTPLMEASASGHEIIVQHLLNHGVKVSETDRSGDTARTLAIKYGHKKIVGLIDQHRASVPKALRMDSGRYEDLSSSDESSSAPRRQRPARKAKGPSIHEGPQALAKITAVGTRVKSPPHTEENAFFTNDAVTIRSSSSSSEGLAKALGLGHEASLESNEDSDQAEVLCNRKHGKSFSKGKNRHSDCQGPLNTANSVTPGQHCIFPPSEEPLYAGPKNLAEFLDQIGCLKYLPVLEGQDVDLRVFLTLTEADLKEVGISLFGPKRKMTSAIARWHSSARPPSDALEQSYADRLEAEMQEMAIQLHKKCEEAELLKGQVSQEQELRAVAEGCLMEHEMVRMGFQAQLEVTLSAAKDAGCLLQHIRKHQEDLSSRLKGESASCNRARISKGSVHGGSRLPQNLSELLRSLEESTREMGKALCAVNQNLEKLKPPDKSKQNWTEP
ncbi:ankyrin repeat and SAM domain-containing protein 3 isoform X2 [Ambystoma mexicanum]|uniref:ankyrin repeat and SAM domain-containing protein 3 isoform X2 n=1 Tax=Ambystoma mexicanum TaxID=8296 RepID=UPI0037E8200D